MIAEFLNNIAIRLGLIPKITPDLTGIFVVCQQQVWITTWMNRFAWVMLFAQLLAILIFPPSIETVLTCLAAIAAVGAAIVVLRGYFYAIDTVRSLANSGIIALNTLNFQQQTIDNQRETLISQSETLDALVEQSADARALWLMIDQIQASGWMWSIGRMNTSDYTGPLAFLWRSDVKVVRGKMQMIVVSGRGDSLVAALNDAISKTAKAMES